MCIRTSFASNSLPLTVRRIVISLAVFTGKVLGTGTQSNYWSGTDTGGQVQLTLGLSRHGVSRMDSLVQYR